jgi:8-amino-3,8-dideoxy-alpha-D-manno-octulosonate transaminase
MAGYEVIGNEELDEIKEVFSNGGVLFRHGFDQLRNDCYKVKSFEYEFSKFMGAKYALAVSSGTAALRVALAAAKIGPGDEVITQSFTFVATVEAIIESGAAPVCAEVDTTLNIDPADLESRITPKTKAVIAVHMLGTPARLTEIKQICNRHNLLLIEDAAWGCGGGLEGKSLGTIGNIGTFSFDFAKTMTTGEGGMVVFDDIDMFERASAWHDHGHENNPAVPRWEDTRSSSGFNFRMMELQGAVGLAQLRKLPFVIQAQRENKTRLWDMISDINEIESRAVPENAMETADALVFLLPSKEKATRCRNELLKVGVSTKILPEAYTWHFAGTWSHMPELCRSHGQDLVNAFPRSKKILERAVSLPVGVQMEDDVPRKVRSALIAALAL